MGSRLRRWIEDLLPWYDRAVERQRNARTERIVKHSEEARKRADRVIAEYRQAATTHTAASDALIKEARRGDE